MSKVLVTESYLSSIAEAIRSKLSDSAQYSPSEMANAIQSITASLGSKSISANGTYSAVSDGYDGYDVIDVEVLPNLQDITVYENGLYTVSSEYDGFGNVLVSVSGGGGGSESSNNIFKSICERSTLELSDSTATFVAKYAFYRYGDDSNTSLKLRLPNVSTVYESAFYSARLTEISLPICSIVKQEAFHRTKISTITLPSCSLIESSAFAYCDTLVSAELNAVTSIYTDSFLKCQKLKNVSIPNCVYIGQAAFSSCTSLKEIYAPSCTTVATGAFAGNAELESAKFPLLNTVSSSMFYWCSILSDVSFDNVGTIAANAFISCSSLSTISLPKCYEIRNNAFIRCYMLLSVYLLNSSVVSLQSAVAQAFSSTPILGYTTKTNGSYGTVYVPSSLYNDYITNSRWSEIASRIASYVEE